LDVESGEVVGILGRNGAGKSTLLKLIARVTAPDSGQIERHGRIGSLLEVGTGFHPELTGRENVFLSGAILGMSRGEIRRQFDEIVAYADIGPFLDTPVKRYSSGMFVRLGFAIAAHLRSEILLLDEVLAVGDAAFQNKCLSKVRELANEEGRTVLFVSHNMSSIQKLCERTIYLNESTIGFDGATREGVTTYLADLAPDGDPGSLGQAKSLLNRRNTNDPHELWFSEITVSADEMHAEAIARESSITVTIAVTNHTRLDDEMLAIRLANDADEPICTFTTEHYPITRQRRAAVDTYELRVPRLPLAPGTYWLDLGLLSAPGGHLVDDVRRAISFRVADPQLTEDEWSRTVGQGAVAIDATWNVNSQQT
jgi:lipopolysaccharide transport system ATP-binding protein